MLPFSLKKVLCNLSAGIVPKQYILGFGIGKKKQTLTAFCEPSVSYITAYFSFSHVPCEIDSN